jgi:hypothetical protein
VTAVARGSSLTMKSGFSQYLFVGGSEAGAVNTKSTFGDPPGGCGQTPIGHSPSGNPRGSFRTTGNLSVIAGIGVSGYSVRPEGPNIGSVLCGTTVATAPFSVDMDNFSVKAAGTVVVLVGTSGVGSLTASLIQGHGLACSSSTTEVNQTVTKGQDDGAAVAVLTAPVNAGAGCYVSVSGTTYNTVPQSVGIWTEAYLLVPER